MPYRVENPYTKPSIYFGKKAHDHHICLTIGH